MATLGHVAVGLAAGRWESKRVRPLLGGGVPAMFAYSALSLLPDADVLGLRLGVSYGAEWGHRGASHSLTFALLLGLLLAGLASRWARPFLRTFLLTAMVIASHGLLDALTDGGLGAALFWPFSRARLFAPVTPLPVGPIGKAVFSLWGAQVILTEALFFAPVLVYALWPRKEGHANAALEGSAGLE